MKEIRLNLATFEDIHAYGMHGVLEVFFDDLMQEIARGNMIIIERRYENAEPDVDSEIRTREELEKFKRRFLITVYK